MPSRTLRSGLDKSLRNAAEVYQELLDTPDRGMPGRLLRDGRGVAVVPRVPGPAREFVDVLSGRG